VTGLLFDWTPKVGDGFVDWLDARCGCAESPEFGTRGHVCIAEWMKP
jgi:hypothetical protein